MPVINIDGKPIGDGKPGGIATRLRQEFHKFAAIS
jgi:D-alanine transaminase